MKITTFIPALSILAVPVLARAHGGHGDLVGFSGGSEHVANSPFHLLAIGVLGVVAYALVRAGGAALRARRNGKAVRAALPDVTER